jgi:hypothetical protein
MLLTEKEAKFVIFEQALAESVNATSFLPALFTHLALLASLAFLGCIPSFVWGVLRNIASGV